MLQGASVWCCVSRCCVCYWLSLPPAKAASQRVEQQQQRSRGVAWQQEDWEQEFVSQFGFRQPGGRHLWQCWLQLQRARGCCAALQARPHQLLVLELAVPAWLCGCLQQGLV